MNKKRAKTFVLVLTVVSLFVLGWFANAFFGNPISHTLAKHTAQKHLTEHYGDTDYHLEEVFYNFKDGTYHVKITSPSSIDTVFSLYISMSGELLSDGYDAVLDGFMTARRLDDAYRELTDTVFQDSNFPYACDISFGILEIYPKQDFENPEMTDLPTYALKQNELILDKIYDIRELGAQAGHLVIYVQDDTITLERAAKIMLDLKNIFDDAQIPFAAMDFTLEYPNPENGSWSDVRVNVANFLYKDIYEDGMIERVHTADQELKAYYEELDAKK